MTIQPPKTLTRGQFAKTKAAKKPKASYGKYLAYLLHNRPARVEATQARVAAANDPLSPLTDQQIRSRATTDVHSQVDPIVADIRRQIGAQTRAGMGAIGGYTNQLAGQLGAYQGSAANIYGQAQASQAGSDAALSGMLSGQGDELARALASKLGAAGMGQPVIDKTTGEVKATGAGSAGALYGTGSASLSALISQGASAQDYAAKLPGIARLGGLQQAGNLQLSANKNMADQIGAVTSQVPGAVTSAITKYRGDELDKALARQANETKQTEAILGAQAAAAKARAQAAVAADKSAQGWAKIKQAGDRLTLQGSNTSFNQTVKAAGLALDQKQYKLALAREARLKRTAATKGAKGGFTAKQKQDMVETSYDTAKHRFLGEVIDNNGYITGIDPSEKRSPRETLELLIGHGIPFSIAIKAIQRFGKRPDAPPEWKATLGWTK